MQTRLELTSVVVACILLTAVKMPARDLLFVIAGLSVCTSLSSPSLPFRLPQPASVVDTHVHITNLTLLNYPWALPPGAGLSCPCVQTSGTPCGCDWTPALYKASSSAMRASQFVFVEVAADHALWLVEAQWVQSLADAGTAPVGGIVAGAPPGFGVPGADMTQLAADLDALAALPLARGIRASGLNFSDPSTFGTVVSHVALLASRGLSVDLITPVGAPGVGAAIARLAEALPVATFVLDHVGSPGADPAAFADWAAGIALVGTAPNVYVKLGGILQYFKSSGVFPTAAQTSPFVTTTLAAFGWGRVMFEGNW